MSSAISFGCQQLPSEKTSSTNIEFKAQCELTRMNVECISSRHLKSTRDLECFEKQSIKFYMEWESHVYKANMRMYFTRAQHREH